jgi:hypothetical protein
MKINITFYFFSFKIREKNNQKQIKNDNQYIVSEKSLKSIKKTKNFLEKKINIIIIKNQKFYGKMENNVERTLMINKKYSVILKYITKCNV